MDKPNLYYKIPTMEEIRSKQINIVFVPRYYGYIETLKKKKGDLNYEKYPTARKVN